MAEERLSGPIICGYCGVQSTGYQHNRTVLFVDGLREFGPEQIIVSPCECIIDFPEFANNGIEMVFDDAVCESGVIIADQLTNEIILEFYDQFELDDEEIE